MHNLNNSLAHILQNNNDYLVEVSLAFQKCIGLHMWLIWITNSSIIN